MYEQFYGLKQKPFNLTPDPEFIFFTEKHREAFAHLVYGIKERRGFIEITGEVGTGKTTLCRALLNEFEEDIKLALILNPALSDVELLMAINQELFVPNRGESKKDLLDALNDYLIEQHSHSVNVVLIIDESQNLSKETLEQIRMISNLETAKAKLIQIVLVGQPELREKLKSPELRQLNQRITVRYHISNLSVEETSAYIYHRLRIAGSEGRIIFTPDGIKLIHQYSKGIPRLINAICDQALLAGYISERFQIDPPLIKLALQELGTEKPGFANINFPKFKTNKINFGWVTSAILMFAILFIWWKINPELENSPERTDFEVASGNIPAEINNISQNSKPIEPTKIPEEKETKSEIIETDSGEIEPVLNMNSVDKALNEAIEKAKGEINLTLRPLSEPVAEKLVSPEEKSLGLFLSESGEIMESDDYDSSSTDDINRYLGLERWQEPNVLKSESAGLLALLSWWGIDELELNAWRNSEGYGSEEWKEAILNKFQFELWPIKVSLRYLKNVNLPAILLTNSEEKEAKVLLNYDPPEVWTLWCPRTGLSEVSLEEINSWNIVGTHVITPQVPYGAQLLSLGVRDSTDTKVKSLQIDLKKVGLFKANPTGFYGRVTLGTVKAFQKKYKLKYDGIVGPETALLIYVTAHRDELPMLMDNRKISEL